MPILNTKNTQTPMLTLNQKMPGEQKAYRPVKQHRVYRPGELPHWLKTHKKVLQHKLPNIIPNKPPQIIFDPKSFSKKASKNKPKTKKTHQKNSESEDDEELAAEVDLSNLQVQKLPGEDSTEKSSRVKSRSRRAALKNSLLKNLKMKENLKKLKAPSANTSKDQIPKVLKTPSETKERNVEGENHSSGEDEGAESEESSEAEFAQHSVMQKRLGEAKPRFIARKARGEMDLETARNELALQLKSQGEAEERKAKERRRAQSVALVIALSREEAEVDERERDAALAELPDDTDDVDEEAEFERWKVRELKRMQADVAKRHQFETEQNVVEMRRAMDDDSRDRDNVKAKSQRYVKKQDKIGFLQKYFHRGSFYQDDDLIGKKVMERNFNAPVGEDKYTNRLMLPEVMQVKNFGTASRTKYTHLVDQDTTYTNQKPRGPKAPKVQKIESEEKMLAEGEERAAPIMGDFNNPNNPWIDFRSAKPRFRGGGLTGFDRPSKRAKR